MNLSVKLAIYFVGVIASNLLFSSLTYACNEEYRIKNSTNDTIIEFYIIYEDESRSGNLLKGNVIEREDDVIIEIDKSYNINIVFITDRHLKYIAPVEDTCDHYIISMFQNTGSNRRKNTIVLRID